MIFPAEDVEDVFSRGRMPVSTPNSWIHPLDFGYQKGTETNLATHLTLRVLVVFALRVHVKSFKQKTHPWVHAEPETFRKSVVGFHEPTRVGTMAHLR